VKLGDTISAVATPIARAFGADCIDQTTGGLRNDSPCAKARDRLNAGENFLGVMWDRFFAERKKGENMKTFIIQVAVDAERSSDIDQKKIEESCGGEVVSVNPRPVAPVQRLANLGAAQQQQALKSDRDTK